MIITRQTVIEKLVAYLNQHITLAELVDWAENTFIDAELQPDEDIDLLMNIISYLAAADTDYFPLNWDVLVEFFEKLAVKVKVVVA